jgi:hypothetical protein
VRIIAKTILAAAGIAAATPALASDLPTKKRAPAPAPAPSLSDWHFDLTLYGWALNLTGEAGVGPFPTAPVFASFGDILRHLDGVAMGSIVARNDTFIVGLDLIWARLGTDLTFRDPSSRLFGAGANLNLNLAVVTGFGGLKIPVGPPNLDLYGILGFRDIDLDLSNTLQVPMVGFERSASSSKNWIVPIAGLAATYRIDDKWFTNGELDAGGLSHSATAQGLASVGYNWTRSISTTLGYRVLYAYDQQSNGPLHNFRFQATLYGPFAGFKYSF